MTTTLTRKPAATVPAPSLPQPAPHRTAALTTTLRDRRNHGDLLPLAAHLTRHGLRNPVSVSLGGRVIIGARRLLAASIAGLDVIPARTVTTVQQALDVIIRERLADQGDPDTAAFAELPTILALLELDAAIRELQWWPRDGSTGTRMDHRMALARVSDNPDGSYFWNASHYSRGRALWLGAQGLRSNNGGRPVRIPDRDRETAADLLAGLTHRTTSRLTAASAKWLAVTAPDPGRTATGGRTFASEDVPALVASLRGYTGAVTRAGLPGPDLTDADRADLDATLTKLVNRLTAIRKGIRQ